MATRQLTKDYNRILSKTWGDIPDKITRPRQAVRVVHRLIELHLRGRDRPMFYKIGGRTSTWSYDGRTMQVCVTNGWRELAHGLGHYIGRRLGYKDHGDRHLELEREVAAFIVKRLQPKLPSTVQVVTTPTVSA